MKQILVVDDSLVARITIKKIFAKLFPEITIIDLEKPSDAIELLKKTKFSLASLDYNMPDMIGPELGSKLLEIQSDLKIVILTANIQKTATERILGLGFHFLPKPITENTIKSIVSILESE